MLTFHILFPLPLQVLPHLQASWESDGDSSASFLFGGHPCVAPGSWGFDQFTPQHQR